jgi:hypothetical protein
MLRRALSGCRRTAVVRWASAVSTRGPIVPSTPELRATRFCLTLGTYKASELAARAYDAVAWRLCRLRRDLNFPDMQSLEEAEFLALLHTSSPRRISHRHRA